MKKKTFIIWTTLQSYIRHKHFGKGAASPSGVAEDVTLLEAHALRVVSGLAGDG